MGWIWPVCFDKGHGWDNVPAALSYSPPKNQRSLENLWFFCWCGLSLFTWVVLEHGISKMAKDFVWLLHQGWNILGLNLLQMSPSHPKWFIRLTLENMISDISWLYGLYFLDAQIAHELLEMPIDEKGWPHPMWGWWKMASSLSIHSNVKSGMNPCFLFGTPFWPWIIEQGFHSTEPALCDNFDCFEAWKTAATSGFEQGWVCCTRKLWTVWLGMGE